MKRVSCQLENSIVLTPELYTKETNYNLFWSNLVIYNTDPKVMFLRSRIGFLFFSRGLRVFQGFPGD